MKNFDPRWQTLVCSARQHSTFSPEDDLPHGFFTRVLARARLGAQESWDEILTRLGLRALVATTLLFLPSAGYVFSEWSTPSEMEVPSLPQTISSEFFWP